MIDMTNLPSTVAEPINANVDPETYFAHFRFTFTTFVDEKQLYREINDGLIALETSTTVDNTRLEILMKLAEQFQSESEWKEEAFIRIDWLQRLYKAEAELGGVDSKEELRKLRNLIAPVRSCPLKSKLLEKINDLESSMPAKSFSKKPTKLELFMEEALKEAGDEFVNLGKNGRKYVITEVLKQAGDHVNTAQVKILASQLEQRVLSLLEVTDRAEMIAKLEQLPLSNFSNLEMKRKERIADLLIEKKGWTGLLSLDREIAQLNVTLEREERENYERTYFIDLPDGKAATAINLRFTSLDELSRGAEKDSRN